MAKQKFKAKYTERERGPPTLTHYASEAICSFLREDSKVSGHYKLDVINKEARALACDT